MAKSKEYNFGKFVTITNDSRVDGEVLFEVYDNVLGFVVFETTSWEKAKAKAQDLKWHREEQHKKYG